jgi:Undecaprenyl-phosphate glucose phosphotransferase
MAAEGRFARRAVIVGAGQHGERLARHLHQYGTPYLSVLGLFDDRKDRVPSSVAGYEVLGDTNHLLKFVETHNVEVIIIALPWSAEQRLLHLIKLFAVKPIQLRLAPDLIGFNFLDRSTTTDARLPMLHLFDRPISGWSHAAKTIEDWIITLTILLFLGPLMLLIALAIKLDSPGPVLFRQKRYGFNNQPIEVFKFRSMYHNAVNQDGSRQASKDDPRITRLGRFLRKSSLDELPQVLNVLKGDMSIVGPRPHPLALRSEGRHFEEVVDRYAARHRVKPGITGWAQVNGWRGETDTLEKIQHRVEHDLYYIDHWSVWFDLRIILKTLRVVWDDQNAY